MMRWFFRRSMQPAKAPLELDDVRRLRLAPGDILVCRSPRPLRLEQRQMLEKMLREGIPATKIIVLEEGLSFEVVQPQDAKS